MKKMLFVVILFFSSFFPLLAAPVISNVHYSAGTSAATISWNTDVTSTTQLTYCPGYTTTWTNTTEVANLTTSHTVTLSGPFSSYIYKFKPISKDSVGATTIGTQRNTHVIITPGIMFDGWDTTKAIIKFTTEDGTTQPSFSYVEYGPTTAYGTSTAIATSKGHAFALTGLTVGSTINYRVRSSMPYGEFIGQNYSAVVPANSPTVDPSQVLVLKNLASATSISIADYYALKRNIPSTNVVNLSIPGSVSLGTVANYQTYVRDPVKAALDANGGALKNTVRYIVVTKGIQYGAAGGAIDLFLYDPYEVLGGGNPYYRKNYRFSTPVVSGSNTMYLVTCIDGSTDEVCKGLIDKAIYAGKYAKPGYGTGYWDSQAGLDPNNGYYPPDKAFRTSDAICKAAGYDSVLDMNDNRFGTPPAPSHCPDALFYQGWYCGLYEDVFDWKVGAVAWHLESSTASGLQNTGTTNQHWVCGFLNSGVTATLGAVNEPYVSGFAEGDYFSQAFMQGYTFGEACFMSTTWMRWMMCFVGDPIYRLSNNPQVDTTPPVVTNIASTGVAGYTDTQEKIYWETDDPCNSQVEYGLTASYGSTSALDKWMGCRHNVILTGLNAGSTYHYRILTTDPAGNQTITGDYTFTTTGAVPPSAPVGLSATATDRAVNLKWTANTQTDLMGYKVYRNTVAGATGRVLIATLGTSVTYQDNSGLTNGTKYYYVITAYDSLSESAVSAEVNATPGPLAAPSNVAATPGDGMINLSWDPVLDTLVTGYAIYRSTESGVYGSALAIKYNGGNYYRDTTAANGTTYYYVVRTLGSTESANSTEVNALPQVGFGTPDLIATVVYQKGLAPSAGYDGVVSTGMGSSWTTTLYDTGYWNIRLSGSSAYEDLIYFNLGDTGGWSQVVSAVLSLYSPDLKVADTISARQMTDPDSLGTTFQSGWAPANQYNTMEGATKAYRRQGISADSAIKWRNTDTTNSTNNLETACLAPETGGSLSYTSAATWYNHTVTAAVESFRANTAPNQGWLISCTGTANLSISSEKSGTVNLRPKLTVRYKVLNPVNPVISNAAVSSYTKTSAVITWKTDVPCKSKVEYSTDMSYSSSTIEDPALVTEHSQTINGLTEETSYHFRIKAEDSGAQITYSPDNILITKPGAQTSKVVFMFILSLGYGQDQNNEIYTMNMSGNVRTRLTNNNSVERNPAWSPDGTQIVCIQAPTPFSPFYLYIMDADGRNQRRVNTMAGNCWDPSFSKDGNYIYFVNDNYAGTTAIYRINIDGSNLTKVSTGESDATLKKPVCSPDGTKIMYISGATGNQEVYVMNSDGTNSVNVSNDPSNDNQACWSPDGTQIAFISDRNGNYQVYKMNSNGSTQTKLTNNTNATLESAVTWSADGTKIVHEYESNVFGTHYVYSMNPDGSGAYKLSNTAYNDAEPSMVMPAAGADVTPPVISAVTSGSITGTSAVITWTTNENSDSQAEYGITTGYGLITALNTALVTSHTVTISGLTAGTLYHYKVESKDVSGNLAGSIDYTFTTLAGAPSVINLAPAAGNNASLTTVSISGFGFYGGTGSSTVTGVVLDNLGGTVITISSYSVLTDTSIQNAIVPSGKPAGTYDVRVSTTTGTNATSTVKFVMTTTVSAPTVTNITANTGSNLTVATVTISGTGFNGGTGSGAVASVKLSDTANTFLTISGAAINDTSISGAVVPAGIAVGTYDVKVTTPGGTNTTSTVKFSVTTPVPAVTNIVTNTGNNLSATTVAVTGSGFFGGLGSSTVSGVQLGSTPIVTYTVGSNTSITGMVIPAGIAAGSYDLKVTAAGGTNTTSAVKFTVTTPAPTVINIVTNTGSNLSATTAAVTGTGFFGGMGSSTVTGVVLGTTPITTYTVTSTTAITGLIIPSGIAVGTYDLKVTTAGGTNTTSTVKFTVTTPAPTVSNIAANTGSNLSATTVSVTGTGFFGGVGSSTITSVVLGTTPITTYTAVSTTSITGLVIPSGIGTGTYDLKVTAAGGANTTSAVKFTVTTPVPGISGITPSNCNYNQSVTITVTGSNFFGGLASSNVSAVKLYTTPVTNIAGYSVINNTSISNVIIPAGIFAGTYALKVTTNGGGESIGSNFVVNSPTPVVTNMTPGDGFKHLNNTITITGSGFFGGLGSNSVTRVQMTGPSTVTITSYSTASDTNILNAVVPSGITAGTYDVLVTANGKTNGTSIGKYEAKTSVLAPKILTIVASTNEIDILYDSDMDIAMATNPSNFTVVSNGVFINLAGATLTYSNRITKLSGLPVLTTNVTVRVVNVEDLAGNAIINDGSNVLNGPIDITAPAGTNVINAGASITGSVNVTLALSAADGGSGMSLASSEMRFSNDGSTWSAPESYGTTKVWTLSAGDGVKTVYVRYKDAAGNWSSANITDTITLDTTAPTGTVIINSGTSSTSSTTVTLTLSAADANSLSQMQFSNDNITYSMAEAYGISKTWTITAGDGTKTVYVKYKDSVGNWSAGITDTIVLDTTGPTGSVVINGGQVSTMLTTVSLTLSGTDTGSGVVSMQISNDGVSWTTYAYAAAKVWSIPAGEGVKTVYVKYIDALGNASGVNATDTIALCLVQYLKVEATPDKVISGDMVTIKVTACLTDSTMSTNYYNSIVYNNTDLNGIPLGSYTFTGTGTRNISNNNVFKTIGRQTITVVDSVIPTITGSVSVKVFDAKLINAATGGLFTSIDGTSMYIPAGALEADTYLGFSVTDNPPEVGTDYKLKKTVSPVCRDYGKLILSPWELNDITFKKAVTITIPYESADVTGLDEKTLRIFYYDGIKGKYEIVPGVQTISGGKVTASVTRFTAYRIIGTYLASNLDDVIGYPSPFNISTAVGGKFKVRNLPVDCTMTVYNIAGEKIRELSEASQSVSNAGWIEWDGKNEIGETVGQGMYVYVIKTADGQKKTGKVGVIK